MRTIKAVSQSYTASEQILWLLGVFRRMVNDCIQIGLKENITSLKSLSLKSYHPLAKYDVCTSYRLTAISAATRILRNYRRAKRKTKNAKEPYARKPILVVCYNLRIEAGNLFLPFRAGERISIPLNSHVRATIKGFTVRSVTLTRNSCALSYTKDVVEIRPVGLIGVDRNLGNVTTVASDGTTATHDLSEAVQVKAKYREVRSHFKRKDVRVSKQVNGKYGKKQQDKVRQILHHASKLIVEEAKKKRYGIAMEILTGMRRHYRRGNGQARWYRGQMNSWSYFELQHQIEYKAKWEGLPVIYVHPQGTSSKCSICG